MGAIFCDRTQLDVNWMLLTVHSSRLGKLYGITNVGSSLEPGVPKGFAPQPLEIGSPVSPGDRLETNSSRLPFFCIDQRQRPACANHFNHTVRIDNGQRTLTRFAGRQMGPRALQGRLLAIHLVRNDFELHSALLTVSIFGGKQ